MGKGDKRTKKGKRWRGSYGNTRPKPEDQKKTKRREAKEQLASLDMQGTLGAVFALQLPRAPIGLCR